MPNIVKVQEIREQQYTLSFPRVLAESMGVSKGQEVEWKVSGKQRLELDLNPESVRIRKEKEEERRKKAQEEWEEFQANYKEEPQEEAEAETWIKKNTEY